MEKPYDSWECDTCGGQDFNSKGDCKFCIKNGRNKKKRKS